MIDNYHFGHIVIDKVAYHKDVIIFPDHVQSNWWREQGHNMKLKDIQHIFDVSELRNLVVGTGQFSVMKIDPDVNQYLKENNINLHAEPTPKAVKIFNRLILIDDGVVGAFHLTC